MKPWNTSDYCVELPANPGWALAEKALDRVWRFNFTTPGFCLLDVGPGVDAHTLRSWMVALKEQLSAIAVRRGGQPFAYRSLGRFDQQDTTKFHLDGAPEQSMLMLGYEPSRVRSRLFLADYTQAAFDRGITPLQFLQDFNPMYRRGEELLRDYTTQLPEPGEGHCRILLINNSALPYSDARQNALGVMHKAEMVNPTASERRIVNSTMLVEGEEDQVARDQQAEFVSTDRISPKVY